MRLARLPPSCPVSHSPLLTETTGQAVVLTCPSGWLSAWARLVKYGRDPGCRKRRASITGGWVKHVGGRDRVRT
jgi:hypothetical protein